MAKLFGFSIEDNEKKPKGIVSPVPQNNEDGADFYLQSGFYGQYVDIEGVYKTEYDLIRRYREMSLHPEADKAIEDIVNEAIVSDLYDSPIEVELSNLNASDKLKKAIREEFKIIKEIMDFDKKSHEIFKNWYVDGRLFYLKVIDIDKPENGIQDLRYIDPLKIKHIRKEKKKENDKAGFKGTIPVSTRAPEDYPEIEEHFIYTPNSGANRGPGNFGASKASIKIAKDSIAFCTSGLVDRNRNTVLSYLHKGIKALNQLRMIEDSLVIYRISRAPERRIFYIDVGNLPKVKAEQYLKDVMMRYRNKMVYDANTGEVRDDKKFMSMMEDFWLPRREGGRGTEISTLPGGQNLGELTDVEYFQKKLFRSLNVPESRLADNSGFSLGRSSEILRDELKFTKFVGRMRKRFSNLFHDILKTQLILKNICTPEEWEGMSDHIQYDYLYDNHFAELKDAELMNDRLGLVASADPYIGKYFSIDYIRRKVLRQTDDEINEQNKLMDEERAAGMIPPTEQEMQMAQMAMDAEQKTQTSKPKSEIEPEVDTDKVEAPESPKGGEI